MPKGPLDGIRILDLTTMASGPLATAILGDQGADVVRIESPVRGDAMRSIGPCRGGLSALFTNLNRNKRSIAIALGNPQGVEIFDRLAADADVVIQNFRPGAVERMGVGPERLCARFPELVYVSISGFGDVGPLADQPGYDSVIQANSGIAAHQADLETGAPVFVRSVVCDKGTALHTAQLVTAALFTRERGSGGQHVRVSMLHTSIAFLWPDGAQNHTFLGEGASEPLSAAALPSVLPTRDGYISITVIQDPEFQSLCRAIDRPDLSDDPRFVQTGPRARNRSQLNELIDPTLRALSTSELAKRLKSDGVPHALIAEPAKLHESPQVVASEILMEFEHPAAGRLRQPRPVGDFDRTPLSVRRHAPMLGEQTDEIAREAGYSDDQIAQLREASILV
jgi:crotonobetainyl-CoA:carnitine CoA-transferase CaiB-like acyl-CoA transferase